MLYLIPTPALIKKPIGSKKLLDLTPLLSKSTRKSLLPVASLSFP